MRTSKTVTTETYETVQVHDYTTTVIPPTCTENGYTLHQCDCGASYRDNIVQALGHNYVETRRSELYIHYKCTRCGNLYQRPIITIPIDPNPPVEYSLDEDVGTVSTTGCHTERTLISTVTERHDYIYAGGKLLRETITTTAANGKVSTQILDFTYDATGVPYSLTYTNGTSTTIFYYITNLQGDVVSLITAGGAVAATYSYDPYGKPLQTIADPNSIANRNPLRYRGYYYDNESGFYYLQSRYYDPAICRFIKCGVVILGLLSENRR